MKKFMFAFLAVAFVFGLVAQTAVAEDRMTMTGAIRVRALNLNNYSDLDSDDKTDELNYFDQRFRLGTTITPADGVKAVLRCDFAEDSWGSGNWDGSRYDENSELQVDHAYLDVTKGIFNVKAGQHYLSLGNAYAYDNQQTGMTFTFSTPVVIKVAWMKITEGGANTDLDSDDSGGLGSTQDLDHYVLDLAYATDTFTIEGYYAMQKDGVSGDDGEANEPTLFGVLGTFAVGPVNIIANLEMFGGQASDDVDYTGMQFLADASIAMNDMVTIGGDLIYSTGVSEDDLGEKVKVTRMPNAFAATRYYADYGAFNGDFTPLGDGDVFDPLGTQAGAIGGAIYAKIVPVETVTIYGQLAYLVGAEDYDEDVYPIGFANGTVFNLSVQWGFTQNAHVALGYNYATAELQDSDLAEDSAQGIIARLQVDF